MAIALRYAARSDVGLVRSNNQDSGYAGPHLLVVADGMGGHAGGDIASSLTVAAMAGLDGESHGADALAHLEQAIANAHIEIVNRVALDPTLAGMGTTVTSILRSGSRLALAHIGDSRGYLLHEGELTQVTTDHSYVQYLVETGRITPEEAEHHPRRNVVLRVLGDVEADMEVDVSMREAKVGDRWLLCSDGLSGVVSHETIEHAMAETIDLDECADLLVQLALKGGAPDNVTCILADIVEMDDLSDGGAPPTVPEVVGAAALTRDVPSQAADGPAARAANLTKDASQDTYELVEDNYEEATGKKRRKGRRIGWSLVIIGVVAAIFAGLGFGYQWSQSQYYVGVGTGENKDNVMIYQGIPQTIGPIKLSHPVQVQSTEIKQLTDYAARRVQETIPAKSLKEAQELVDTLPTQNKK